MAAPLLPSAPSEPAPFLRSAWRHLSSLEGAHGSSSSSSGGLRSPCAACCVSFVLEAAPAPACLTSHAPQVADGQLADDTLAPEDTSKYILRVNQEHPDGVTTEVGKYHFEKGSRTFHTVSELTPNSTYTVQVCGARHSPEGHAGLSSEGSTAPTQQLLGTRKRHQQEHRPQRPTESSDPTQHVKGRTGDCPGPCKGTTTRRNVTQGVNRAPPNLGRGGGWEKGSIDRHHEISYDEHWRRRRRKIF